MMVRTGILISAGLAILLGTAPVLAEPHQPKPTPQAPAGKVIKNNTVAASDIQPVKQMEGTRCERTDARLEPQPLASIGG